MRVITTTQDLTQACAELAAADFVAVDTEFMREQTFWPILCLVQLAGPTAQVIVDPLADGIDLAPFYALMADERVTKVFHAARQDIEIVWHQADLIPHPIFDTQVAAMVCGFGEAISYVNLVKQITNVDIDKSSRFTDWSRRPLSQRQLTYALGDVTHLCDVYLALRKQLESSGRASWVDEEMATLTDRATYESHPEDAWKRLKMRARNRKGFAVLIELAAWRERAAQEQNVPRNRVLRDEALYDIATHAPTETTDLSGLRTLSDGFSRSHRAREIIEAVRQGLARDFKTLPPMPVNAQLPADRAALVDLLRVLLKASAARHKVAPRLIADTDDLERIAMGDDADVPALKGWRRRLFGEDAERLKQGSVALGVEHGVVVAVPTASKAARDGSAV